MKTLNKTLKTIFSFGLIFVLLSSCLDSKKDFQRDVIFSNKLGFIDGKYKVEIDDGIFFDKIGYSGSGASVLCQDYDCIDCVTITDIPNTYGQIPFTVTKIGFTFNEVWFGYIPKGKIGQCTIIELNNNNLKKVY